MVNKLLIIALTVVAAGLGLSYHHSLVQESGENLVADAYYGRLAHVKDDVEDGAPLDFVFYFSDEERDYTGVSFNALHAAASGGNEDVINYLLEQGLDINAQTPTGWTPLFIAARDGQAEAAKLLIFRGANLNLQTDLGATALLMALTQPYQTEEDRLSLLVYMLKRGADPNLATNHGLPPLYYAITKQNVQAVEVLLEAGAQVTLDLLQTADRLPAGPDRQKITALLQAASQKS